MTKAVVVYKSCTVRGGAFAAGLIWPMMATLVIVAMTLVHAAEALRQVDYNELERNRAIGLVGSSGDLERGGVLPNESPPDGADFKPVRGRPPQQSDSRKRRHDLPADAHVNRRSRLQSRAETWARRARLNSTIRYRQRRPRLAIQIRPLRIQTWSWPKLNTCAA